MAIKARLTNQAKIQTLALGLEGAPYYAAKGAEITFPTEEAYEKAVNLYGEDLFEKVAAGPKAPSAGKGGKK